MTSAADIGSASTAATAVPQLVGLVSLLGYDCEIWPRTLNSERDTQADIGTATSYIQKWSHQKPMSCLAVPQDGFNGVINSYYQAIAPYADVYVLQGQRHQGSTSDYVGTLGPQITSVQSYLTSTAKQIWAQIDVTGSPPNYSLLWNCLVALYNSGNPMDGIVLWFSPGSDSNPYTMVSQYIRAPNSAGTGPSIWR